MAWKAASEKCDAAVRERAQAAAEAKERVERAARVVICNSEMVKRSMDDLETKQDEVIERRAVLRFIWSHGLNGELPKSDNDRIEKLLGQDLTGWENHPVHGVWRAAFDALMEDPDAALPNGR